MAKREAARDDILAALAEVFRAHGYEGTTLSLITEATGLGKGSLYNLFPGGKEQMANEVLAAIDLWFNEKIYTPLRTAADPAKGIADMYAATSDYFHSGQRVCLVGVVALGASRDLFGEKVKVYFAGWVDALAAALRHLGYGNVEARRKSEQAVLEIQGALVLARAFDDPKVFLRALKESERRLLQR
ncbi:MAG: TetR/AcrR family transcriptional regulator [Afipia sp.]|nr:TetR/AcrR family transcriptional regulator [Afipia sp.]